MLAQARCISSVNRVAAIRCLFGFTVFVLATLIMLTFAASSYGAQTTVNFNRDIKPIFEKHCVSCHGPEEEEAFRIDRRDDALNYIIAGEPEESHLYEVLVTDDEDMLMPPPSEENPLSESQITLVKTWIAEGAKWPVAGEETEDDTVDPPTADAATGDVTPLVPDPTAEPDVDADAEKPADDGSITPELLANAGGSLHPAAVHLPIGLLLASGLFALLSLRGNFVMSDCAYYCLWLGALGAIGACVTGWYYSPMEHRGAVNVLDDLWDQSQPVFWHRTAALGASIFALMMALMASSARARDPDDGTLWKVGAIVLAGVIGWTGHLGGELTYGKKHYKELNSVMDKLIPGGFFAEQPKEADEADEENATDDAAEPDVDNATSGSTDEASESGLLGGDSG